MKKINTLPPIESDSAAIQRLRELTINGRLTADAVKSDARSKKSPLHRHFLWNDKLCGEIHRTEQARELIRRFIIHEVVETQLVKVKYFTRDPSRPSDEQGYIALPKLQQNRKMALMMLKGEVARIQSAMTRARGYALVLGLETEYEVMLDEVLSFSDKIPKAA